MRYKKFKLFTESEQETGSSDIKFEDISEDRLREIIRYIAYERDGATLTPLYSENELMCAIIKLIKCDVKHARSIVGTMEKLGLGLCTNEDVLSFNHNRYDLLRFANMRGYVSDEEVEQYYEEHEQ